MTTAKITKDVIAQDYEDNYLELLHLLNQGAGLEHSLMIAYLYALFSIKDEYSDVKGDLSRQSYREHAPVRRGGTGVIKEKHNFLQICIEEMQHLSIVNRFLAELGASPNFVPHVYPFSSDLYPFPIDLYPLDRYMAATYLWVEADSCALSSAPECQGSSEPPEFIAEVIAVIKKGAPSHGGEEVFSGAVSHLGSLYNRVVEVTRKVAADPPDFLPKPFPFALWEEKLQWLIDQGELAHYEFFKDVFTGEAFAGQPDPSIWEPDNPSYPAWNLLRGTAYKNQPDTFKDETVRRLAWLSNLHYWILLGFLDLAYRDFDGKMRYKAIDNMTQALWSLGSSLARNHQAGIPFDQFSTVYNYGRNPEQTLHILRRLLLEARTLMQELQKDNQLPEDYDTTLIEMSLDGLPVGPGKFQPYWVFQS